MPNDPDPDHDLPDPKIDFCTTAFIGSEMMWSRLHFIKRAIHKIVCKGYLVLDILYNKGYSSKVLLNL